MNPATYKGGIIATYTIVNIATFTEVNTATLTEGNTAAYTGVKPVIHIGKNKSTLKLQNVAAKSSYRQDCHLHLNKDRPLRRKEVCFHRGGSFKEIELSRLS